MTFLALPPPSFLYGILISLLIYPLLFYYISPLLVSKFATSSLQNKVAKYDKDKLYKFHSMLPSVAHAAAQIIGVATMVFWGREGFDSLDSRPSVVEFDDRMFVPYGLTPLGPSVYMGIFVGYLLADVVASPSLSVLGYTFVFHHIAASLAWAYCASYRIMQPLAALLQFNELSTPLLHLRQLLLFSGCTSKDFSLTIVNLTFFALFGMIRVAPLPWIIFHWINTDFRAIKNEVGIGGAVVLSLFVTVHVGLQGSWFLTMCGKLVGMAKGAFSSKHTKKI